MRTPLFASFRSMFALLLCAALLPGLGACKKEQKAPAAAGSAAEKPAVKPTESAPATPAAGDTAGSAAPAAPTPEEAAAAAEAAAASAMVPEGEPGPRPPAVTDADVAVMEKTTSLLEKVGAAVNGVGNDCKKVAAAIKSVSGEAESLMREGKQIVERYNGDEAALLWINRSFARRIMPVVVKLNGHPCAQETDVKAALAPFEF